VIDAKIIAFCGRAGHGKSTAAQYLVERYGATRFAFAGPVKELARRLYGLTSWDTDTAEGKTSVVRIAIDEGADTWRPTVRELLQRVGNECREVLGAGVWVGACLTAIRKHAEGNPGALCVIDDLRYPNEAKAVLGVGGTVITLERPDAPVIADPNHPSEAGVALCQSSMILKGFTVDGVRHELDLLMSRLDGGFSAGTRRYLTD
jgi:hypothetical protein